MAKKTKKSKTTKAAKKVEFKFEPVVQTVTTLPDKAFKVIFRACWQNREIRSLEYALYCLQCDYQQTEVGTEVNKALDVAVNLLCEKISQLCRNLCGDAGIIDPTYWDADLDVVLGEMFEEKFAEM